MLRKHYGKTQYLIKSYKNGKAIHCPIHPGNPKAILTVQNLLKNSMKINNYTLYFFTIINIIIIIYSLIILFYTKKKKKNVS